MSLVSSQWRRERERQEKESVSLTKWKRSRDVLSHGMWNEKAWRHKKEEAGRKSVWHTHQDRIRRDAECLNITEVFKHQKHLRGFNVSIKAALVWWWAETQCLCVCLIERVSQSGMAVYNSNMVTLWGNVIKREAYKKPNKTLLLLLYYYIIRPRKHFCGSKGSKS